MRVIDCASLAHIQTFGLVKVREFVSIMRYSNEQGTEVVLEMLGYLQGLHGLLLPTM